MYRPRRSREIRYQDLDLWPGRFKTGTWAWALHRVSGLALLLFLVAHILATGSVLLGRGVYDRVMAVLHRPGFALAELGVLAALLYHGLNGLRIILLDLGIGAGRQKWLFWGALSMAAVGTTIGGYLWLLPRALAR